MQVVLSVMTDVVLTMLAALLFLMIIRALLSLLAPDSDHPVINVVFNVTDAIMAPAQTLLDKTGWFRNSVIDMAYLLTVAGLWVICLLFLLI